MVFTFAFEADTFKTVSDQAYSPSLCQFYQPPLKGHTSYEPSRAGRDARRRCISIGISICPPLYQKKVAVHGLIGCDRTWQT